MSTIHSLVTQSFNYALKSFTLGFCLFRNKLQQITPFVTCAKIFNFS